MIKRASYIGLYSQYIFKWQISLIGKNLTDEKTFMWGNDIPLGSLGFNGAYFKMIDPPRTVELTARINF